MKESIFSTIVGCIGAFIAQLFGGWSDAMTTLIIFMACDYLTGLLVAGFFKKSKKSKSGSLSSHAAVKGLIKKGGELLVILVACRLDLTLGTDYIQTASIIAFIASETISLIENLGLMGVPMPKVITNAIELLKGEEESESKN